MKTCVRIFLVFSGLGILLTVFSFSARSQEDPAQVRDRARRILEKGDYQRTLPLGETGGSTTSGHSSGSERGIEFEVDPRRIDADRQNALALGDGFGRVARLFFFVGAAVLVVLAGFWLTGEFRRRAGRMSELRSIGPYPAVGVERAAAWTPASELADEGRYDEALHALLLEAIETLSRRVSTRPPASMTSRELVCGLQLRNGVREGFEALVRAVERSLFGGQSVERSGYERALGSFRQATGEEGV